MDSSKSTEKTLLYAMAGLLGIVGVNSVIDLYNKFAKSKSQKSDGQPEPVSETQLKKKASRNAKKPNIYKIVLTGGPCAGKTTAMTTISDRLREQGWRVYNVPECATLVANGGGLININKMTLEENIRFQSVLSQYMMDQEDRFVEIAMLGGDSPAVVLCDRGVMDNRAYIDEQAWQAVLDENGWNLVEVRDKRYDGVVHLVTAADGAEKFYTLENNKARYESSLEVAVDIDKKLKNAWYGHPNFFIVDNNVSGFNEKVNNAYNAVLQILGLKSDVPKKFNKFLLKKTGEDLLPRLPEDAKVETFDLEDTFLASADKNSEVRIRKRGQRGNFFYEHVVTTYPRSLDDKEYHGDGIEKKKQISAREYISLLESRDKSRCTLEKCRQAFIWQGRFLFIDTFLNVKGGFSIIYLPSNVHIEDLKLPEGIEVEMDVTDVREYSSYEVSKLQPHPYKKRNA